MKEKIGQLNINNFQNCVSIYNEEAFIHRLQEADLVILDFGIFVGQEKTLGVSQKEWIDKYLGNVSFVVMPGGERCKSNVCFQMLLETFFEHKLSRKDKIIVIGGGALCDVASYVASVYMRGIHLSLVPSTLLAMVDASIGGKTAINIQHLKNMVGTFYLPSENIIFPDILASLDSSTLKDGMAETIKAGFLQDEEIINIVEQHPNIYKEDFTKNKDIWIELITRAIKVKLYVVQHDFLEQDIRAYLNLGHTFAHAHEACSQDKGTPVSHGEAVGLGIRVAMELGLQLKDEQGAPLTRRDYVERVHNILNALEYPKSYEGYDSTMLVNKMYMDKKRVGNQIRFIVQRSQGNTLIVPVKQDIIIKILQSLGGK